MRTILARFSILFVLSVIFLALLVGMAELNSWVPTNSAAALAGPQLSISSNIPANPNSTVIVPVLFTSNGAQISSTVFSIDYDETWLSFDETVPNALEFTLPTDFSGQCSPDQGDADGEIDCFIIDPLVPLASLPDGVILNITLRTKNPTSPVAAKAGFSTSSPPASFGGTAGQSVPGSTLDGSVQMGAGFPSWAYLPFIWKNIITPPTPIPTVTVTPTDTITPSVTPDPSVTPTPPTCSDLIINSGFENSTGWERPITNYTAVYSNKLPRNGLRSMRTGIVLSSDNIYSYSSARQGVSISNDAKSALLSLWVYPISGETNLTLAAPELTLGEPVDTQNFSGDFQYILILDQYDNLLETLDIGLSNSQTWTHKSFDLSHYIGSYSKLKIHFGTYNNGYGGVSAMYVDDVTLQVCNK
ncbi:MAG TPA: hypothetical protein VMW34_07790 [Anaerolineales bacterium]|nr:hypothetical protein [Anaerolineales bacterium]